MPCPFTTLLLCPFGGLHLPTVESTYPPIYNSGPFVEARVSKVEVVRCAGRVLTKGKEIRLGLGSRMRRGRPSVEADVVNQCCH